MREHCVNFFFIAFQLMWFSFNFAIEWLVSQSIGIVRIFFYYPFLQLPFWLDKNDHRLWYNIQKFMYMKVYLIMLFMAMDQIVWIIDGLENSWHSENMISLR